MHSHVHMHRRRGITSRHSPLYGKGVPLVGVISCYGFYLLCFVGSSGGCVGVNHLSGLLSIGVRGVGG